jgi:hypothetical protein
VPLGVFIPDLNTAPTLAPAIVGRNKVKPTSSTVAGLVIEPTSEASQILMRMHPVSTGSGDFNWGISAITNPSGHPRKDVVLTWGYNNSPDGGGFDLAGEPSIAFRMESLFSLTPGAEWFEVHLQYNHPSGFTCRPMGYTIDRNLQTVAETDDVTSVAFSDPADDLNYLTLSRSTFTTQAGNAVLVNNTSALSQRAAGGTIVPLLSLDSTDVVKVGTGAGAGSNVTVQGNLMAGGTLAASGNVALGGGAPTTFPLAVRGANGAAFITALRVEGGNNADNAGPVVSVGPNVQNFGAKLYGARWASTDRGARLVGVGSGGAESTYLHVNGESGLIQFFTGSIERARFDASGNLALGTGALATTATNGFLNIPSMAGTPTGVPTAFTGRVPLVYDTTGHKLWIYDGGWKGVVLA